MAQGLRWVPFVCGIALAAPTLLATPQQQRPEFRGGVDLVRLDVSVLNRDGHPVRGLTADDFTIRDNGRAYTPSFFEAIEIPLVLGTDDSWTSAVSPDVTSNQVRDDGRLIVIVLDDSSLPGTTSRPQQQAKRVAHSVIDQLAPSDLAAVVFTLNDSTAQGFTNDKNRLRRAVEGLRPGFITLHETMFRDIDQHFERGSIRTLDFVAETLIEAPARRKALVLIGSGVPVRWGDLDDPKRLDALEMFKRAQRANVAVYSFNAYGLIAPNSNELPRIRSRREYLQTVSENTGGFSIVNVNNPAESVQRVFEENSAYYLIGYEPVDPPEPGGFRTVDVDVSRPDVRVRTRRGYYAPEPDSEPELTPEERTLREAVSSLLPVGQMPMRLQVAPFPMPGSDEAAIIVAVELRQPAPEEPTEHTVQLALTAYDTRGRSRASTQRSASIVAEPGDDKVRVEVLSRLDIEPGRYEIRLAGHDARANLTGSVFRDLDVPDFTRDGVRLSGVLISTESPRPTAPLDGVADLVPVVPTTLREFSRDGTARAFVRVHQGGRRALVDVDVNISILAADDHIAMSEVRSLAVGQFSKDRAADIDVTLPLANLPTGAYLLTVDIDGEDDETAMRNVRFTVK